MRIYYGWVIVAIGMTVLTLTLGATLNAFGLFVLPVSEEFNLSRANVNTAVIILNFGIALISPFLGRLLDHHSPKRIMAVSAALLGASLVILGLSHNVWLSVAVLAAPLSIAISGVGTLTSPALVARWFTVHRGRAMAITAIGLSLASVVGVPLTGLLIDLFGWRQCLILMGCALAVLLLLMAAFVRDNPGPDDVEANAPERTHGAGQAQRSHVGETPRKAPELLRTPQFWTIVLSTSLVAGGMHTFVISIVPLAQEGGVSATQGASLISVFGVAAIAGKLAYAAVGDRLDGIWLLSGVFGVLGLSNATLLFGDDYFYLAACSAVFGLAVGAMMPAFYALLADRFGPASFGTSTGLATLVMTISGAILIRFGGEAFDRTGSYDFMFASFFVLKLAAAGLMLSTRILDRPAAAGVAPTA